MVERFVGRRKHDWQRLEDLTALARAKRIGALSAEQIVDLGYLYQRAVADLSVARRDFPHDRVSLYLNQLVAGAHAVVYRSEANEWRRVALFFRRGFPTLVRQTFPFTLAAFLIFAVAGVAGFASTLFVADSRAFLVPGEIAATIRQQRMWTEEIALPSPLLSSLIMTNNIRVALLAFAGGVLWGTLSFFVLAYNGLMLGAIAGMCQAYGLSLRLWSFVAPHGVIELTVIFITGGAGLQLGYALLRPGVHPRLAALRQAAQRVVRLLFGCVPLLVIAGLIEGFVSPSSLPTLAKLGFGALTAVALYGYLLLAGRSKQEEATVAHGIPGAPRRFPA